MAATELGPGTGTAADPYIIKDVATLDAMRNDPKAHYMMVADVDIGGGLWEPFIFEGELNGRGHRITNVQVDNSSKTNVITGFFEILRGGGSVYDLNLETGAPVHVTGGAGSSGAAYTGVLAGAADTDYQVRNVCVRGQVSSGGGNGRTGGLFGIAWDSTGAGSLGCTLRNCVSLVYTGSGGDPLVGNLGSLNAFVSNVYSSDISGNTSSKGNTINLSEAQLSDPQNYPYRFDFDYGVWEIDGDGLPRVKENPVPVIETGGGPGPAPARARLAGIVTVDGSPAERQVIIVNNHPDGPQVVGEGTSNPDGSFDIEYGDFGVSVVALAIDEYGQPFETETALNLGTIVHPTTPNGYVYEVTQAGTTGTEEPVWATVQTVQSGSVTFNPLPYYRPIASGPLTGEPVV